MDETFGGMEAEAEAVAADATGSPPGNGAIYPDDPSKDAFCRLCAGLGAIRHAVNRLPVAGEMRFAASGDRARRLAEIGDELMRLAVEVVKNGGTPEKPVRLGMRRRSPS